MKSFRLTFPILLCIIIGLFLVLKLKLLFVRQFDPDEFAYLHWAWLMVQGNIPYKDFFYYATPLFLAPLSFLFVIPEGPAIALAGRMLMFVFYCLLLFFTYTTARKLTGNQIVALVSTLFLASFPMTYDKTIEIRPDTLMMVLYLASIVSLQKKRYVVAGLMSSINALMFMKVVILFPALIPLFLSHTRGLIRRLGLSMFGAIIPILLFVLYLSYHGILWSAWDAVVNTSRLVNNTQWGFPPLTGLMPFPYVYLTEGGMSFPWIVNSLLILLSIPGIPILFIQSKKTPSYAFFALLFYLLSIGLFLLFPRPHMQYFIPLTIIASIFASLTVSTLLQTLARKLYAPWIHAVGITTISLLLLLSFWMQTTDRIRQGNSNDEQLQVLSDVASIVDPDETIYDGVGSYIFRPDGYFICCHHYEQFIDKLDPSIGSLRDQLVALHTKFIVLDQKGFAFWTPLPADVAFIITHYTPSKYKKIYTLGVRFQCDQGVCKQLNVHGNPISEKEVHTFPIVIPEQYVIHIEPKGADITINNSTYHHNDSIHLPIGSYTFSPPFGVTGFSVQLDR